jgi:hypothetical protein
MSANRTRQIQFFRDAVFGAQKPNVLQFVVLGQFAFWGWLHWALLEQEQFATPRARFGATSEATIGRATAEAIPIVFKTCRRLRS